jgi:hypothetical protein
VADDDLLRVINRLEPLSLRALSPKQEKHHHFPCADATLSRADRCVPSAVELSGAAWIPRRSPLADCDLMRLSSSICFGSPATLVHLIRPRLCRACPAKSGWQRRLRVLKEPFGAHLLAILSRDSFTRHSRVQAKLVAETDLRFHMMSLWRFRTVCR